MRSFEIELKKETPFNHLNAADSNKVAWEKQATKVFINWYNTTFNNHLTFLTNNQPAKPDVSCLLDGNKIDIEIAHLYGTEQDAMSILGKELSEYTKSELAQLEKTTTAEQRLISALNRILEQKSHKHYNSEHTWLVIRNVHPGWNTEKIKRASDKIVLPLNHPFEQIWIVGDITAASGALLINLSN